MGWSNIFSGALSMIPGAGQVKGVLEMASGVAGAIGGDTGKKIENGAQELADGLQEADQQELPPEQRTELEKFAKKHEQRMRELGLQDTQGARSFAAKELQSDDQYVRRTRPKMVRMVVWLAILFVFAVMVLVGIVLGFSDSLDESEVSLLIGMMQYVGGFVFGMVVIMFRSYTTRRSMDKAMEMTGTMPSSLTDKMMQMVGGKKAKE